MQFPISGTKKPPLPGGRDGLQSYKSDRMRLVLVVSMQSVHTVHTGIALFEELGSNLREHSVGQNVLFLDGILGSFGLQQLPSISNMVW